MRVLVTGGGGFIGRHVVNDLSARGHDVRASSNAPHSLFPLSVEVVPPTMTTQEIVWGECVGSMDVVIHLAARAHVLREQSVEPLEEFRRVNVRATVELARQAAAAGVRRFIFISSIGVNGTATTGKPFTAEDSPSPTELYAVSKWEAEQQLRAIAATSSMEITIVRLPLVHGPHVRGNFLRLLRLVDLGVPLPFASIRNLRSYLGIGNLCDFLACCLSHPAAAGELFLLADGEDLSTPCLLTELAAAMHRRARLYPCPPAPLRALAALIGRSSELQRLTSSLQVDCSRARELLGWTPPNNSRTGVAAMAAWYQSQRGR